MPSDSVIGLPCEKRDSGVIRSRSMPSADQSRCASSISLSDLLTQTALRRPGAIAEHEPPAEPYSAFCVLGRSADRVEGFIHGPIAGQIIGMSFTGIDHCLELGIGEALADIGRQDRPIRQLWRCDRCHGSRLDELGWVWLCTGNPDRLQSVLLVDRFG